MSTYTMSYCTYHSDPMALEPWYATFRMDEYTMALQAEAISEVLTLTPGEKQPRLGSYGLTPPCRAVTYSVLRGMFIPLGNWAAYHKLVVQDLARPMFRPEAFRLENGSALWPTPDHTALLIPLSNGKACLDLLPRGTNLAIPIVWEPRMVLHLHEMGVQFSGTGSVRFVYVLLRVAVAPTTPQFRMLYV
ncbi:hypothetical protein ACHAPT_009919 [Fusarium lateritium]